MINTLEIKSEQLKKGTYSVGSGSETILIIGSCRAVAYLTYLRDWNVLNNNRFTIHFADPFNLNWDMQENRTDYEAELIKQETNNELLETLKSCSIFIHEYYANAQMFNCDKSAAKNIYRFGLNPTIDITLPNWNDIFVLAREIVGFDLDLKKMAIQDYNVNNKLSDRTLWAIDEKRKANLERFFEICLKTDFPEFAEIFANKYKDVRMFWTFNHVSKHFTQALFWLMNNKFLKLNMDGYKISEVDLFDNNYTHLCEYDHGYNWPEKIKLLKESL